MNTALKGRIVFKMFFRPFWHRKVTIFNVQMYPIWKNITWRYVTLLYDQKFQMLILLSSLLKQTYFYELQAWCLKISVGGPLCYKIQAKMAEIRLPGVNHLLWIGMLAELTCGERVCLKLVDVLLLLFKSG